MPKSNHLIVYISDNVGLMTRLTHRMAYQEMYPNATLSPDWDVLEQVASNFHLDPNAPREFRWVKGHQDETQKELSVAEKFNVMADSLAAIAHEDCSPIPTKPVLLPAAQCHLFIGATVVSSHYHKAIREAYTLPEYIDYMSHRHSWDPTARKVVDWQLLTQAVAKISPISHTQLVKFLHDKLPMNYELSKSDPHRSARCHYCQAPETFHHLLQCNNPINFVSKSTTKLSTF